MTDQWRYIALLDEFPMDVWEILAEQRWEVDPVLPRPLLRLTKAGESADDHAALRQELRTILEQSRTGANVLSDTHLPIPSELVGTSAERKLADLTTTRLATTSAISDIPSTFHVPWPGAVAGPAPAAGPVSGTSAATAQSDGPAPLAKPAEPTPAASELAELVDKGFAALALPGNLWALYIDEDERAAFAKTTAEDLYAARIALARRVGWVLAPELELIDLLDRLSEEDPDVTPSKSVTKAILQARVDTAKSEADLVRKDVELKAELLKQQSQVTQLLAEFLKQAQVWRGLARTGKRFLVGSTLFATAVTGFLAFLLFDNKLDAWAFPAAVFVLAVFAISPAVLLIIERPLQGIDQWMPGGKAQDGQPGTPTTPSADATGSKASASPAAPGSTQ